MTSPAPAPETATADPHFGFDCAVVEALLAEHEAEIRRLSKRCAGLAAERDAALVDAAAFAARLNELDRQRGTAQHVSA